MLASTLLAAMISLSRPAAGALFAKPQTVAPPNAPTAARPGPAVYIKTSRPLSAQETQALQGLAALPGVTKIEARQNFAISPAASGVPMDGVHFHVWFDGAAPLAAARAAGALPSAEDGAAAYPHLTDGALRRTLAQAEAPRLSALEAKLPGLARVKTSWETNPYSGGATSERRIDLYFVDRAAMEGARPSLPKLPERGPGWERHGWPAFRGLEDALEGWNIYTYVIGGSWAPGRALKRLASLIGGASKPIEPLSITDAEVRAEAAVVAYYQGQALMDHAASRDAVRSSLTERGATAAQLAEFERLTRR